MLALLNYFKLLQVADYVKNYIGDDRSAKQFSKEYIEKRSKYRNSLKKKNNRGEDDLLKPKAFVVLNAGASPEGLYDDLKEHVKSAVGGWKYPRWIEIREDLPKTATGKIQRFKLRD